MRAIVLVTGLVLGLAACGGGSGGGDDNPAIDAPTGDGSTALALPPLNAGLDYQLGGAYPPPAGVKIVSRDRAETPAAGLYNICYVNGFQIQEAEATEWMTQHADLILRDGNGNPVIDTDWNEMLIDIGTPEKRSRVATIVGGWIDGCRTAGFDAVEIDNLDSYTRSGSRLAESDAVAMMATFSARAHAQHLAIAQKNSAEIVVRAAELGTDFAVSEECNHYSECQTYRDGYGDHVLVIEYVRADFTKGCSQFPGLSIVLRDRNLVAPGAAAYVFDGC